MFAIVVCDRHSDVTAVPGIIYVSMFFLFLFVFCDLISFSFFQTPLFLCDSCTNVATSVLIYISFTSSQIFDSGTFSIYTTLDQIF